MNLNQTRVIDPILSTITVGFRNPALVGDLLFPRAPVTLRAGKIIEFGKESFQLVNTKRAPGAAVMQIALGYEGNPFVLDQHSLSGKVPLEHMEEASKGPGIDLGRRASTTALEIILLGTEYEQASLARNPATYLPSHTVALTGTDKWTDASTDPLTSLDLGREAVRSRIGRYPNTLMLGPAAFNAAKNNPKVTDKLKYTTSDSVTKEMLAAQWNIKSVHVGEAIWMEEDGTPHDIWGNDAILAYVPENEATKETPAFGLTYVLQGCPCVEMPHINNETKSWVFPVVYERKPVVVGQAAGYLIQGAA
ncbi:MAG: major capsid protein [Magnetococcales bacterium]|nr:major capsid protein [Magnetococcales bacterium]